MPDYPGKFDYLDENGATVSQGACRLSFGGESCAVTPAAGVPIAFDLGDVERFVPGEWELRLTLFTGHAIVLRHFGAAFDDMRRELAEAWRDRVVQCLLLEDLEEIARYEGLAAWSGQSARSQIRLFGSNLAVLPEAGEPLQLRLAEIDAVEFDSAAYAVSIRYGGERLTVSRLARKSDEFTQKLRRAMDALRERSIHALGSMFPFLDPDRLARLAIAMPEGRSVALDGLAGIHPKLPAAVLEHAVGEEMRPYFDALRSRALPLPLMAGFKLAQAGDEENEPDESPGDGGRPLFFWFFFPLASGRIAAWEAAAGSGRATYFFRLPGGPVEPPIAALTRGLALVNFRREPIYIPNDSLERQPRYRRYAIARRRLPDLRTLRAAFLGRAIHSSPEAWAAQVAGIAGLA